MHRPDRAPYLAVLVIASVLGLLVVDGLSALTEMVELGGWEPWLSFDDGRLVTALMAALSAGAGVTAIRLGVQADTSGNLLPGRIVWLVFGLGCLVVGAVDVANVELSAGEIDLLGLVPLVTGAVIAWRLRRLRLVAGLLAAGLLLLILNPIAGGIEVDLFSNPDNYTPGAPGEPYVFIHSALVRMWWVTRFQELSELAAMGFFLLAFDGVPAPRAVAE